MDIFILYSKPSEHLHKAIWPMHKSPNLAPQANPQLYKVFCVLQILGCICLSRLERSNFRTEPPSATIFGMPYKKNSVVLPISWYYNPSTRIVRHTNTQRPGAFRGVPGTLWGSLGHPSGFLGPPGVIKACHNSLVWPRPLC